MRHAESANPIGRHVATCGRSIAAGALEVLPLWQFIGLALYPGKERDLCLECCETIETRMRSYRDEHDPHRDKDE